MSSQKLGCRQRQQKDKLDTAQNKKVGLRTGLIKWVKQWKWIVKKDWKKNTIAIEDEIDLIDWCIHVNRPSRAWWRVLTKIE